MQQNLACSSVSFKYDPFGRRIYKSSSSGTSVYAYDGDNLVEETNSSGTAVARLPECRNPCRYQFQPQVGHQYRIRFQARRGYGPDFLSYHSQRTRFRSPSNPASILTIETLGHHPQHALRSHPPGWDSPTAPDTAPDRTVPQPKCPKRGCTCNCRADADDSMPGNVRPGLPRFAFGSATASNCPEAKKAAKRIATQILGMKPKHILCRCVGR